MDKGSNSTAVFLVGSCNFESINSALDREPDGEHLLEILINNVLISGGALNINMMTVPAIESVTPMVTSGAGGVIHTVVLASEVLGVHEVVFCHFMTTDGQKVVVSGRMVSVNEAACISPSLDTKRQGCIAADERWSTGGFY